MVVAAAVMYTGLPTAAFAAVEPPSIESSLESAVSDSPAELTPGEGGTAGPTPGDESGETAAPESPAEEGVEAPTSPAPETTVGC